MRVLLIAGGWSPERDVSLSGAKGIHQALKNLGHQVTPFDPSSGLGGLYDAAKAHDFAFLNLHGSPGEDGLVQAMLDTAGCPYQGSGPAASFMALNKNVSKVLFQEQNLPTPDWEFLPTKPADDWDTSLGYPLFAKPNMGGSSLGMGLVNNRTELDQALGTIYAMGEEALLERFAPGRELTCGILDETPLPLIEICPKNGATFFDYTSKYVQGKAEEICPAPVDDALTKHLQDITLTAHKALGLAGYSRADFIVSDNGPMLLEINTLPGMTPTSLIPQQAAAVGIGFDELIARLLDLGLKRASGAC